MRRAVVSCVTGLMALVVVALPNMAQAGAQFAPGLASLTKPE
jgi:hypothetical protein